MSTPTATDRRRERMLRELVLAVAESITGARPENLLVSERNGSRIRFSDDKHRNYVVENAT